MAAGPVHGSRNTAKKKKEKRKKEKKKDKPKVTFDV